MKKATQEIPNYFFYKSAAEVLRQISQHKGKLDLTFKSLDSMLDLRSRIQLESRIMGGRENKTRSQENMKIRIPTLLLRAKNVEKDTLSIFSSDSVFFTLSTLSGKQLSQVLRPPRKKVKLAKITPNEKKRVVNCLLSQRKNAKSAN